MVYLFMVNTNQTSNNTIAFDLCKITGSLQEYVIFKCHIIILIVLFYFIHVSIYTESTSSSY